MSDLIQLTGLWEGTDKDGNLTLSGNFGNCRLVIFANGYKEEEKHPDFIAYIAKKKDKKDA